MSVATIESVDEKSISYVMSRKTTKKKKNSGGEGLMNLN